MKIDHIHLLVSAVPQLASCLPGDTITQPHNSFRDTLEVRLTPCRQGDLDVPIWRHLLHQVLKGLADVWPREMLLGA
jgi:hypothetical protein